MEQKIGIAFNTEDIIRITMIVTDEDKDEALKFLTEIEKTLREREQAHCKMMIPQGERREG